MTDWPLLMDLKTASRYTGIAFWTVRGLVIDGWIHRANIPSKNRETGQPQSSRRILVYRDELDAFLRARRERNVQPSGDDQPMTTAVKRAERRPKTRTQDRRSVGESAVPPGQGQAVQR